MMEGAPVEDQTLEVDKGSVVVVSDPMSVGTPFTLALVVGVTAFTIAHRKIYRLISTNNQVIQS